MIQATISGYVFALVCAIVIVWQASVDIRRLARYLARRHRQRSVMPEIRDDEKAGAGKYPPRP